MHKWAVRSPPARRPRRHQGFGLRSFLPGLLRYCDTLLELLGASLFIQLFAMVTPLFTMVIIDKVLTTGAMSTLDVLILGLAAIALFDLTIGLLRGSLLADITNRIDVDLVARLFRHLTRLPMSYFGARKTGDTVARVRELEAVRQSLAAEPRLLLLDEPTSALDALAERAIQENLAEMVRGRTVFIVAHRLSTLRICDRVLVLDQGRLIEDGPPRALLSTDGAFARLRRAQVPFAPIGREARDEVLVS